MDSAVQPYALGGGGRLEKHWERARVNAAIENDHSVKATTSNVSAVSFEMGSGAELMNPAAKIAIVFSMGRPSLCPAR